MSEYTEIWLLYKQIDDLQKKLQDEREEHKQIYKRMRENLIEISKSQKVISIPDKDFEVYRLEQEIKRLQFENDNLKSIRCSK